MKSVPATFWDMRDNDAFSSGLINSSAKNVPTAIGSRPTGWRSAPTISSRSLRLATPTIGPTAKRIAARSGRRRIRKARKTRAARMKRSCGEVGSAPTKRDIAPLICEKNTSFRYAGQSMEPPLSSVSRVAEKTQAVP